MFFFAIQLFKPPPSAKFINFTYLQYKCEHLVLRFGRLSKRDFLMLDLKLENTNMVTKLILGYSASFYTRKFLQN